METQEVKLESLPNFRGLGGWKTEDGYTIKNNIIFRSSALTGLPQEDIDTLQKLGVKTVVDFRSQAEVEEHPDDIIKGAVYYNITPNAMVAREAAKDASDAKASSMLDAMPDAMKQYIHEPDRLLIEEMKRLVSDDDSIMVYKKFIHMFKDKSNLPLVFHCRGGKDRAGFGAILILLALGVSKEDIITEYMITQSSNQAVNEAKMKRYATMYDDPQILELRRSLMSAKPAYIHAAFDEMDRMSGNTDNYLHDVLKLSKTDREAIRKNCLVDYQKEGK